MIDSSNFLERALQRYRFRKARPHLIGDVLDFGGNDGELKKLVKGVYLPVNYDHSAMEGKHFDTITCLAVIEHMDVAQVFETFRKFKKSLNKGGRIFLTTPSRISRPFLEFWAAIGITCKENIEEHKHYWSREEIYTLAQRTGFKVRRYERFQLGMNQSAVFEHNPKS